MDYEQIILDIENRVKNNRPTVQVDAMFYQWERDGNSSLTPIFICYIDPTKATHEMMEDLERFDSDAESGIFCRGGKVLSRENHILMMLEFEIRSC